MRRLIFSFLTVVVVALIFTGCAESPQSRFYHLDAAKEQTSVSHSVIPEGTLVVTIGPIRIPDYLDRPQIVTRSGKNEFNLSEFNRWAGSLEKNISLVLVDNISTILPADRFLVLRWTPVIESQIPSSYRVEVVVESFEGAIGGSVSLKAKWGIVTTRGVLQLRRESVIIEQVEGNGYDALVAAMSSALKKLGHDIAEGIESVSKESK
ncbi:MAG: membrane integrity-associated transporter subunit PqiC [Dissulfurispiraceae bacterium]